MDAYEALKETFDDLFQQAVEEGCYTEDEACLLYTSLTTHDLSGKTVVPFCTSGTSSAEASYRLIRSLCPQPLRQRPL